MEFTSLLVCALAVLPNPTVTDVSFAYGDFSHRPVTVGQVSYNDVRQGFLGDCWFLAALSAVASADGGWAEENIQFDPIGQSVSVRLIDYGQSPQWFDVSMDLPMREGSTAYARLSADAGESWVGYVEKALAASCLRSGEPPRYSSLSGGGPNEGFQYLVGDAGLMLWNPSLETIIAFDEPHYAVCVSTRSSTSILPSSHSLVCVDRDPENLTLYDPLSGRVYKGLDAWADVSAVSVARVWSPGDANGDRVVDDADYTLWADSYNRTDVTWRDGDWNGDGLVDDAEYTIWADHFGTVGSATVPAPPAVGMLLAGVAAVVRRRIR